MTAKTRESPTYRRVLTYVKKSWKHFVVGIITTAIAAETSAGFTWFLKPLLNEGFINPDRYFIKWAPLIVFAAFYINSRPPY